MSFFDEIGIKCLINFIFMGLGALIGYGTAVALAVRKERNEAAIDFQSAFFPRWAEGRIGADRRAPGEGKPEGISFGIRCAR